MKPFFSLEHPIATAHRGSRLLWPENTMVAFQGAVDLGYRYLETDLHATADDVLVCLHDDTLDRTTGSKGKVWYRTRAELERVDAGFRFDAIHGFPQRGRDVRVPTLEELVTTFPDVHVTLDLKQKGIEHLLVALVERLNLWDRVIVGSFKDGRIHRFRKLTEGRVATSSGSRETLRFWGMARGGWAANIPADALQVPESSGPLRVVDAKTVAAAHQAGKQVHVWTVNEREDMERLLALGVDGIITDRPDTLKQVLDTRSAGGEWP